MVAGLRRTNCRTQTGLLPICHCKLDMLFRANGNSDPAFERTEQYFGRTRDTLQSMMEADQDCAWRRWRATPFKWRYDGAANFLYIRGLRTTAILAESEYSGVW